MEVSKAEVLRALEEGAGSQWASALMVVLGKRISMGFSWFSFGFLRFCYGFPWFSKNLALSRNGYRIFFHIMASFGKNDDQLHGIWGTEG